ncbi:MCP four helix bundle domain-containing protein [Williamsia deligens]|uniref:Uncharacterized protein n=1 Tax=Williamsia deligens TaxID=321325 RepID=A0ABW3G6M2_9NOCA|nr:hypothetical protein [Williamsia deligens]MCP2193196.1 Lipopolysaccharide export LptBFGC system, permease protein LptF [Williamsia deligens]
MTGDAASLRSRLNRGGVASRDRSSRRADRGPRLTRTERRELITLAREQARSPLSSVRRLAGTTPGRLLLITFLLVLVILGNGWYASVSLDSRTDALRQTISDTEPIAESSQILYSNLSIADASANAAFISGGLEPASLRNRYATAIATASRALIEAAGGTAAENDTVRADLGTLAEQLPVYTGLIESARTNNRLANPVGSAYLSEASNLMQTTILPAAERLYSARATALADPQNRFTTPPWVVYVTLGVVLLALMATHRYLSQRTRRRFNLGLVLAILLTVVAIVWVLVGSLLSVSSVDTAERRGAEPLRELTSARILAQQARSSETLALARRGDQDALQQRVASAFSRITTALDDYRADARTDTDRSIADRAEGALGAWKDAHEAANDMSSAGDIPGATAMAVGSGSNGAAAAYTALDEALIDGIRTTRTAFRDDINTARVVIGYAGTGALVLGAIAAVMTVLGMVPRIREYR